MKKNFLVFIFLLTALFSLASLSAAFDNNANFRDPDNRGGGQRDYTHENATKPISDGGYLGGHDTITAEGMLLKQGVHKNDIDGGRKFNLWATEEAFPSLRIGAHDEDSTKLLDFLIKDPPIGSTGWGDFFNHFYDYRKTKKGFKGRGKPAPLKAKDYIKEIKKIAGCTPGGITNADENKKKMAYEYFGKSLHLLQDMAVPSHTSDDAHPFRKPFEKYVNDHWDQIVNSPSFRENVTADRYLSGSYRFIDISQYWDSLAKISSSCPNEEELYELLHDPITGVDYYAVNEEKLMNNVNKLIPKAIMHTAGYIDAIYDYLTGDTGEEAKCALYYHFLGPGKDHPDDRFDVSDEFYWEKEFGLTEADLTDLLMRTAIKKGKIGVWYWKRFMEIYANAVTRYADAPKEVQYNITTELKAIEQKLEDRRNVAESEWKGAPDIALFAYGFYDASISLLLKFKEPVAFMGLDFDPSIVKDHAVMLVPSGGLYGLENSDILKAKFEEYVGNGGTLIVFAQQHGYEFSVLPVPQEADGTFKRISGYGWTEDQSCFTNAVYIDTYHQIFSGQSKSTPSVNVDGYFIDYPSNATVLLRRTSNGQPAMLMYDYGQGKVIVVSLYSDWAYGHSQASRA